MSYVSTGLLAGMDEQAMKRRVTTPPYDELYRYMVEQWRIVAAQALDAWREALETGEEPYDAVAAFNHAVRALWRAQLEAEGRRSDGPG